MTPAPLLDREFLEKLERLTIHWQKSFAGLVGGHNKSRFPGAGQEFLDHRSFLHGDDLRAVNWSASMGTHGGLKFDYARKLAGALCYVGLVRLDSIEIHGFTSRLQQRVYSSG